MGSGPFWPGKWRAPHNPHNRPGPCHAGWDAAVEFACGHDGTALHALAMARAKIAEQRLASDSWWQLGCPQGGLAIGSSRPAAPRLRRRCPRLPGAEAARLACGRFPQAAANAGTIPVGFAIEKIA